jgi:hypothetical protein
MMRADPLSMVEPDPARRSNQCFLCTWGSRSFDKQEQGTAHFARLMHLLDLYLPTRPGEVLADMVEDYYETKMRTPARERGVELPAIDKAQVVEHLTTTLHTMNPRLWAIVTVRKLEKDKIAMDSFRWLDTHEFDKTMDARYDAKVRLQMEILKSDIHRMAFNDRVDGELMPSHEARLAPTTMLADLRRDPDAGPDVADFVEDFFQRHQQAPDPDPPASSPMAVDPTTSL